MLLLLLFIDKKSFSRFGVRHEGVTEKLSLFLPQIYLDGEVWYKF